jgi:hypothetical protein
MYKKLKTHVHTRVLVQLVIFSLVSLGLLVAVSYDAIIGEIGIGLVLAGLAIGLVVGFVVGRAFLLRWHEDTRKVVMSLDRMSFVLIAAYVAFRIFGEQLLGNYIQGPALSAFTFALLAGILFGRLFSVWRGVMRILRQQGIV